MFIRNLRNLKNCWHVETENPLFIILLFRLLNEKKHLERLNVVKIVVNVKNEDNPPVGDEKKNSL